MNYHDEIVLIALSDLKHLWKFFLAFRRVMFSSQRWRKVFEDGYKDGCKDGCKRQKTHFKKTCTNDLNVLMLNHLIYKVAGPLSTALHAAARGKGRCYPFPQASLQMHIFDKVYIDCT